MALTEFDITGQKVLVVGAGRGIGKGIALAFAEAGADVAITGLTPTGVNKVAREVRALGRVALPITGDATKAADMDRVAQQALAEFGQVDTLVNCVGDAIRKPVVKLPGGKVEGMTEEEWRFILDINLTEAFQGCRAIGPHLLERRQGSVVNISGWASFRGRAESAAYDAAKAGVMRFTECLAQEWAPYGVRVNAIAPGTFPDPEQMSVEAYQTRQETARKQIPLGRTGRLKEIGYLAVSLASPAAAYATPTALATSSSSAATRPSPTAKTSSSQARCSASSPAPS
jgi:NAD(P)-dependent dehydrogenase (short-subunit alcohol dehydrogenase family)